MFRVYLLYTLISSIVENCLSRIACIVFMFTMRKTLLVINVRLTTVVSCACNSWLYFINCSYSTMYLHIV